MSRKLTPATAKQIIDLADNGSTVAQIARLLTEAKLGTEGGNQWHGETVMAWFDRLPDTELKKHWPHVWKSVRARRSRKAKAKKAPAPGLAAIVHARSGTAPKGTKKVASDAAAVVTVLADSSATVHVCDSLDLAMRALITVDPAEGTRLYRAVPLSEVPSLLASAGVTSVTRF